jgi:predicted Rossmann fold nucleotide-binding protein DprA/Smf involved in DNA uptake
MNDEISGQLDSMDATRKSIIQIIQDLSKEELNWNPLPGEANSIYSIVAHLCTSEQGMLHGTVGGLDVQRLVEEPLSSSGDDPKPIIKMIEDVGLQTREILEALPENKLAEKIERGGRRPRSAREWIHLHIRHMSDHLGHIELTKQFCQAGIVEKK